MPHVAILNYVHGSLDDPCCYLLRELTTIWREEGVKVTVLRGPGPRIDADLMILHVDLTVVPIDHVSYLRQYPKVLNGTVVDISKRHISSHLVATADSYDGPVVTKANRNCAGFKEAELAAKGLLPKKFARTFNSYSVYPSTSHVPAELWSDRDVVIEKFLPERKNGQFCLRTWIFLGDQERNFLSFANEPIIKSSNIVRRIPIVKVPDELRGMREELGFDFGRFDYALVNGKVVLYDTNRTPSLGAFSREQYMPTIKRLAAGLNYFL